MSQIYCIAISTYPSNKERLGENGSELEHGENIAKGDGGQPFGDLANNRRVDVKSPGERDAHHAGGQRAHVRNVQADGVTPAMGGMDDCGSWKI